MNITPIRQRLLKFVSPKIADFVVEQLVDITRSGIPEKGTPHPDSVNYPRHRFTHAEPAEEQGVSYKFFYVAEREFQDDYNWEFSSVSVAGAAFKAVMRTYVTPRADFDPESPVDGTAMMDTPAGTFEAGYVLWSVEQERAKDEVLDALFVISRHTYILPFTVLGVQESESGTAYQTQINLYCNGQVVYGGLTIQSLIAAPNNAYWKIQADGTARNGKQITDKWYVVQTGPSKDVNTKYQSVVDRTRPDKFFCPKSESTNIEISILPSLASPPAASAAEGERVEINQVGYIRTTATTSQNGIPQQLTGSDFDERTGKSLLETTELVDASTVAEAVVGTDGRIELYTPYDACKAIKRTVKVVDPGSKTWTEIINYEWPPVLKSLVIEQWTRRDDTVEYYPNVKLKQGFSGPQLATVTQHWQSTPPTIPNPPQMIPEGFTFASPLYTLRVPPCLHGAIAFSISTGTKDPVWKYQTKEEEFLATNYEDWPATISWKEVKNWRGGFLVTTYTIPRPA